MREVNARFIGLKLGKLVEIDTSEYVDVSKLAFLRLRVELDLSKLLVAGFPIQRCGFPTIWVQFQYKKLADFYYLCGRLGHVKLSCPNKDTFTEESDFDYRLRAKSFNLRRSASFRVISQPKPSLALVKGKSVLGESSVSLASSSPIRPPVLTHNVPLLSLPGPPTSISTAPPPCAAVHGFLSAVAGLFSCSSVIGRM